MSVEMPKAWPVGVARTVLPSVGSTMAEAARRAPGLAAPEWILALEQTEGKGRRGRAWLAPPGNFSATLAMRPDEPPAQAALRSFVAALATHDALGTATGQPGLFALKWPNDVLLNGGKLAGILLESAGSGGRITHLAIGIGVNLAAHPPPETLGEVAARPVSLVGETGLILAPEEFLDRIAPAYAAREAVFVARGFGPIREAWLARAARLGETITARTGRETHRGVFETVDESGNLVLSTARGRLAIPAAEVFF